MADIIQDELGPPLGVGLYQIDSDGDCSQQSPAPCKDNHNKLNLPVASW